MYVNCDVSYPWQQILRTVSQSLEHLSLFDLRESTIQQLPSFTDKIPALKSLRLEPCLSLQRCKWPSIVNELLQTFGETIEIVHLGFRKWDGTEADLNSEYLFNLLRAHCGNLADFRHLHLIVSPHAYRKVLRSYGPQVVRADLSCKFTGNDGNAWSHTLQVCPNLQFKELYIRSCPVDLLRVMAPRIDGYIVTTCVQLDATLLEKVELCMAKFQRCTSPLVHLRDGQRTEQTRLLDVLGDMRPFWLQKLKI